MHARTHTHTHCSHLSVETACQFSACLGKPSITKALLPFSALFHILSCSFLFFPPFLHVCNSGCLFSLLEGRNCLCHALSSMARIKALECTKANLLCCSWSSTGTVSFKLFSHFEIWVRKNRNYGGIHLKEHEVSCCRMQQCHKELVKYHHREWIRCLGCLVIVLSASYPSAELPSLSAVAVQAHSVISNKDCVSLVPNWGFKDLFFCDDKRGPALVDQTFN